MPGFYWDRKTTVEEATQLSIFKIKEFGLLHNCTGTLTWTRRNAGTKSSIGLLTTIQSLTTLLVQLPGGIISDKLGRKRVILVASVLGFIPPIIYRYSTHWTTLIIGAIFAAYG